LRIPSGLAFSGLPLPAACTVYLYTACVANSSDVQLPQAAIDPKPASIFLQLIERLARRHSFRRPEDEHFPRGSGHFRLETETKG
jgi:hypothetical protein